MADKFGIHVHFIDAFWSAIGAHPDMAIAIGETGRVAGRRGYRLEQLAVPVKQPRVFGNVAAILAITLRLLFSHPDTFRRQCDAIGIAVGNLEQVARGHLAMRHLFSLFGWRGAEVLALGIILGARQRKACAGGKTQTGKKFAFPHPVFLFKDKGRPRTARAPVFFLVVSACHQFGSAKATSWSDRRGVRMPLPPATNRTYSLPL